MAYDQELADALSANQALALIANHQDSEIARLRAAMATASVRLHGLAKMDRFSHGAVDEVADYLDHEQSP